MRMKESPAVRVCTSTTRYSIELVNWAIQRAVVVLDIKSTYDPATSTTAAQASYIYRSFQPFEFHTVQ
jgi:hypothetical protein